MGVLFFTLIAMSDSILHIQASGLVMNSVHEDHELANDNVTSRFTTESVQNCLHRCRLSSICNLAGVRQQNSSSIECTFASLPCQKDVESITTKRIGSFVYELFKRPRRFYFAFKPNRCLRYNAERDLLDFLQTCEELFCANPDGLYHVPTGKCVTVSSASTPHYLRLEKKCNQGSSFEQIPGPAVKQKSTGHCLHPKDSSFSPVDEIEAVTWPSGCHFPFFFKPEY